MELTESELEELDYLHLLKHSKKFLGQKQSHRMSELQNKQWHNNCKNPGCVGFEGTDLDTNCKICGSELFKF